MHLSASDMLKFCLLMARTTLSKNLAQDSLDHCFRSDTALTAVAEVYFGPNLSMSDSLKPPGPTQTWRIFPQSLLL